MCRYDVTLLTAVPVTVVLNLINWCERAPDIMLLPQPVAPFTNVDKF